jgi:hypothetical protein
MPLVAGRRKTDQNAAATLVPESPDHSVVAAMEAVHA